MRLTSHKATRIRCTNIICTHTLHAINSISYSSLRVAHDSAVASSGLPGPLVWPFSVPPVTRWTKRPLCHLVPGPRLAFHTPPKPVSGTRSRHLLQSTTRDLCIASLPLVNRRLRSLALLAESVSHYHKIDPSSAQVLSVTDLSTDLL